MSVRNIGVDAAAGDRPELKQQFPALSEMLRALNMARKQSSMYGADHPNAQAALVRFTECIDSLVAEVGTATCVFTRPSLIVNDCQYAPTDTHDLYQRLRARGVLGVNLLDGPTPEQALAFLGFLNAEPREVKEQGGPGIYLRRRGVSRIVVTDLVYGQDDDEDQTARASPGPADLDRDVGMALQWLLRQDDDSEDESAPELPIGEILADPDATAKLIREAVTKLHRSRNPKPEMDTLTGQVVSELKDLSGLDHDAWDKATPQVRKAVSKLPSEMRPRNEGFTTAPQTDDDKALGNAWKSADVAQVEAMVSAALSPEHGEDAIAGRTDPGIVDMMEYFSARPAGIMSAWRDELNPAALTASTASTLGTLLSWEQSPADHARIASALADVIARSVESNDMEASSQCASQLAEEAMHADKLSWRAVNARMAFQGLDVAVLRRVAEYALDGDGPCSPTLAADLVVASPELAVDMADLLGAAGGAHFAAALQRGLAESGSAGVACLGRLLRTGAPSQSQMALEALARMRSSKALSEIRDAIQQADEGLIVRTLAVLPILALPDVAESVLPFVSHRSRDVRCAALRALGRLDNPAVLPCLFRVARFRLFGAPGVPEQLAAVEAIGKVEDPQSREFLAHMREIRPFAGRGRAEKLRAAATAAINGMTDGDAGGRTLAA